MNVNSVLYASAFRLLLPHFKRIFFINQIYVVSRYMHCATCHNEQFFYYVMMGLTCHKPHKRHGSLLNRVPLMFTSSSLKRSGESVYHLWIATKNALASSLYVRRTMIAVHPRRYIYTSKVWRFLLYHMNIFEGGRYCSAKVLWPSD